jgi:hypothetical protein
MTPTISSVAISSALMRPAGTMFCLSRSIHWTSSPKNGDTFAAHATLNGHGSTRPLVRNFRKSCNAPSRCTCS